VEKSTRAEVLKERARCASVGSMEEFLRKRRREEEREGAEGEEGEAVNKSKKEQRSSNRKRQCEAGGEKTDRVEERREGWRERGEAEEGVMGWREEMMGMMKKMMEGMEGIKELKEQGNCMKEEIEGLRRDMREKEERWRKEREELRESIRGLEQRMKVMELEMGKGRGQEGMEVVGKKGEEVAERVKEIEWRLERKERQERRKNIIIRGLEVKEGKRREKVEEVMERIGARVKVEEVRKLGGGGLVETVWVRLEGEEQKREVMGRKSRLKGTKEVIMEDWTWRER